MCVCVCVHVCVCVCTCVCVCCVCVCVCVFSSIPPLPPSKKIFVSLFSGIDQGARKRGKNKSESVCVCVLFVHHNYAMYVRVLNRSGDKTQNQKLVC